MKAKQIRLIILTYLLLANSNRVIQAQETDQSARIRELEQTVNSLTQRLTELERHRAGIHRGEQQVGSV